MQIIPTLATGAEYAAPYLGRMNDRMGAGKGTEAVVQMQEIIKSSGSDLRLMVASIRDPSELATLSARVSCIVPVEPNLAILSWPLELQGCDTFTISAAVASKLFMTEDILSAEFEASARRNGAYEEAALPLSMR